MQLKAQRPAKKDKPARPWFEVCKDKDEGTACSYEREVNGEVQTSNGTCKRSGRFTLKKNPDGGSVWFNILSCKKVRDKKDDEKDQNDHPVHPMVAACQDKEAGAKCAFEMKKRGKTKAISGACVQRESHDDKSKQGLACHPARPHPENPIEACKEKDSGAECSFKRGRKAVHGTCALDPWARALACAHRR